WWLVLFTRKSVVEQFTACVPGPLALSSTIPPESALPSEPARPGLPLPLAVFAVALIVLSPLSVIFLLFTHYPAIFFGIVIRGSSAKALYGFFCLLSLVSAIGLLKLQRWGYSLTLGLQVLGLTNGVISMLSPNFASLQREILAPICIRIDSR